MGRRLTKEEREERQQFKRLIQKIRKTNKYAVWKLRILKRDVPSYPSIPKGVQVHHRTEISTLLRMHNINTVQEAIQCKELWRDNLGITLKRGEHFIWTKLSRYKYLTKGFRDMLQSWLSYEIKIDKLDTTIKRKKK